MRKSSLPTRHGLTAVLAMMYMVLFSTLALGFYSTTNSASVISDNEVKGARSLAAAESGMDFTRYQLSRLKLPPNTSDTDLLPAIVTQLGTQLNGTSNMQGKTVALTNGTIY